MMKIENISNDNIKIIGAELKRRRVKQSQTLVNLSSVCSVSYISKIENGKIIPKIHVLEELCIEQGINKEELQTLLEVDSLIEKSIEAFFWKKTQVVQDVYSLVCQFDNYKVNFIKIFYEIGYMHWDKVSKLLNSIRVIKDNLDSFDYELYCYLQMCYENQVNNYPKVYELYYELKYCKNNFLLALASKEMFIAVCKYGFESPVLAYEEYNRRYHSLFNHVDEMMYDLYLKSLINSGYILSASVKKTLDNSLKLYYLLSINDTLEIDELLKIYKPDDYEKLLIATLNHNYSLGEKIYLKIKPNRLTAYENLIAKYCSLLNSKSEDEIANYIISVGIPYAIRVNDGHLFKMFLEKLSQLSFSVGKYKVVASLNLKYFEMKSKCMKCLL